MIAVRQAEVDLEQATQTIKASSATLAAAQAKVTQARANIENARVSNARAQNLVQRGVTSRAQADTSKAELAVAEAQLQAAEADLKSAKAELGVAGIDNPRIEAAQLNLERVQLDLVYTKVHAPTRGVVTNLNLAIGQSDHQRSFLHGRRPDVFDRAVFWHKNDDRAASANGLSVQSVLSLSLIAGALTTQEPSYAALTRLGLTFTGTVAAALTTATLESLCIVWDSRYAAGIKDESSSKSS